VVVGFVSSLVSLLVVGGWVGGWCRLEMVRKERADNVNAAWHARTDLERSENSGVSRDHTETSEQGKEEEDEEKNEGGEEEEEWLRSVDRGLMT
jgi:UPF0716 family protein affecting phage T7 exclusion